MRTGTLRSVILSALLLTAGAACHNPSGKSVSGETANKSAPRSSDDGSSAGPTAATGSGSPGTVPLTPTGSPTGAPTDDPVEAMILQPINNVSLKFRNNPAFVPLFAKAPFHSGDTLKIGDDSRAVVFCKDVCELTTGTYTTCCAAECKLTIRMGRRSGDGHQMLMYKKDLSPTEAAAFDESESKLRELGLGETMTQFLRANLYSNWRLKEAEGELSILSSQLEKPETQRELNIIYTTVTRKTGDMFLFVDNRDRAVKEYEKATKPSRRLLELDPNQVEEKAAAHERLGEIYSENGNKAAAETNYKAAKNIYVNRGESKKATAVDQKMKAKNN